jgi:LmbE family N-acetylglucosaminyl deacetylase
VSSTGSGPSGLPVGDLLTDGPVTVDLPTPASALAIGAHPDDIEFGCGSTLAKWAAAGCTVHHLILTDGSKGSWDPDEDLATLVDIREAECRRAAARLRGIPTGPSGLERERMHFLGCVDGELANGSDERREVVRVIRSVRPAVVLTHDPWRRYRLHPDHRHAGFLVLDAVVAARDPHFFPGVGTAPWRPGSLLLWEPDLPNHLEDATGFDAVKVEALLCHTSQRVSTLGMEPLLRDTDAENSDIERFTAKVRRQLASHGALRALAMAEAFHLISDV